MGDNMKAVLVGIVGMALCFMLPACSFEVSTQAKAEPEKTVAERVKDRPGDTGFLFEQDGCKFYYRSQGFDGFYFAVCKDAHVAFR